MAARADVHRRPSELAVGQKVFLSTSNLPLKLGTRKLASKWTGPFTIVEQLTREAWKLQLPGNWGIHPVFHSSQLKPCVGQTRAVPPVLLEDESEEFEVQAVLEKRVVRGKI